MDWDKMTNNEIQTELKTMEFQYDKLKLDTANGIDKLLKSLYGFEEDFKKGETELKKRLNNSI